MTKWISVEDELPEQNMCSFKDKKRSETVLVCTSWAGRRKVHAAYLRTWFRRPNTWCLEGSAPACHYVTHWMPLPEPPQD